MSTHPRADRPSRRGNWLSWKWFRLRKELYQRTRFGAKPPRCVLLIVGCQRSGTTMMNDLFLLDWNAKIYREMSSLSSRDKAENLRLDPIEKVRRTLLAHRVPLVVCKPLVESQNLPLLLSELPRSKALWMYRHYKDVAHSNLAKFGEGNGIADLAPVARGETAGWRAEKVSVETRALIRRFFSESMNPYDAAALFWYMRNRFFFDHSLARDPRVLLCRYEEMVTDPGAFMRRIYSFVDVPYPGDRIIAPVHPRSVRKGRDIRLSPEIEAVCEQLWRALEEAYAVSPSGPTGH